MVSFKISRNGFNKMKYKKISCLVMYQLFFLNYQNRVILTKNNRILYTYRMRLIFYLYFCSKFHN